jgi:hypothetical protein
MTRHMIVEAWFDETLSFYLFSISTIQEDSVIIIIISHHSFSLQIDQAVSGADLLENKKHISIYICFCFPYPNIMQHISVGNPELLNPKIESWTSTVGSKMLRTDFAVS